MIHTELTGKRRGKLETNGLNDMEGEEEKENILCDLLINIEELLETEVGQSFSTVI